MPPLTAVDVVPGKEASFQLLVRHIANASAEVSIQKSVGLQVKWFEVGYVLVNAPMGPPNSSGEPHQPPKLPRGWYPDPLLPLPRMLLIANWLMSLWATVVTTDKHRCSSASATVTITLQVPGEAAFVSRSIEVRCHEVELPARPTMKTAFALHRGCAGGESAARNCEANPPHGNFSTGSAAFFDSGGGLASAYKNASDAELHTIWQEYGSYVETKLLSPSYEPLRHAATRDCRYPAV